MALDCKDELIRHIRASLHKENENLDRFRNYREMADDDYTVLLLTRLIKEEEEHILLLAGLEMQLKHNPGLTHEQICSRMDTVDSILTQDTLKGISGAISENHLESIKEIIASKEDTYKHFEQLAYQSEDKTFKMVFSRMAEFEKLHYQQFLKEIEQHM